MAIEQKIIRLKNQRHLTNHKIPFKSCRFMQKNYICTPKIPKAHVVELVDTLP